MTTWQAEISGTTYQLSDRNPLDLVTITGVGGSPVRRLNQRGPLQHGETDLGYRLDPRMVNLVLALTTSSLAASDGARDSLTYMFGPRLSAPLKLRCTRDDGAIRELLCYTSGMVDTPITETERIGVFQKVGVQLVAPDPNWYDPEAQQVSAGLAVLSAGLTVPLAVPWLMASGTGSDGRIQVQYLGTVDEFPTITLVGPIADALVVNETTGDQLSFSGYTIAAGTSVTIDLAYGQKTVTLQDGSNLIAELTADSDLATWRLASILETGDGTNIHRMSGSSLTASSQVIVVYHNRYLSL